MTGCCWGLQQCPVWSMIRSFLPPPPLPSGFLPLARSPWRQAPKTWARSRECAWGRCAGAEDVREADVHRLAGTGYVHGPGEGAEGPAGTSCPGLISTMSPLRRAGKGGRGLSLSLEQQHQGLFLRASPCLARRCRFHGTGQVLWLEELPGAGGRWELPRGLSSSTGGAAEGTHPRGAHIPPGPCGTGTIALALSTAGLDSTALCWL